MAKTSKISSTKWEEVDGVLCAVLIARDGIGREVRVAVPAAAFLTLSGEARRRIAASEAKGQRVPLPPEWHHLRFLSVETMTVGTTDNQKVGVILDRGLETEFGLRIEPEHSRELGQQLLAKAEELLGSPPSNRN